MNKDRLVIAAFDLSSFKFGGAFGYFPERIIQRPFREEFPKTLGSDRERANLAMSRVIGYVKDAKPGLVLVEDTTISFMRKGKQGGFASRGRQDYYAKGNLRILDYYCSSLGIDFQLVAIKSMKLTCLGSGNATKEDSIKYIVDKYGVECDTDDHADAALLIDYYFLTQGK